MSITASNDPCLAEKDELICSIEPTKSQKMRFQALRKNSTGKYFCIKTKKLLYVWNKKER